MIKILLSCHWLFFHIYKRVNGAKVIQLHLWGFKLHNVNFTMTCGYFRLISNEALLKIVNTASGSVTNIAIPCEMDF